MMENNELMVKLTEALADSEIAERIEKAQSLEEIQSCFADGGLEMTKEETEALLAGIYEGNAMHIAEDELSDNELEMVSGGSLFAGAAFVASVCVLARMGVGFVTALGGGGYKAGAVSPIYGIGYNLGKMVRGKFIG